MSFESLNLNRQLLINVKKNGYEKPTPIQRATIPLVLSGQDVLGCAQTGTGKTAAFALPILQRLMQKMPAEDEPRVIRALILTPTRELAQQIYDNFVSYGEKTRVVSCVLYGGVNQLKQVEALHRGADVVIACPGRLLDLMNQGYVHLENVGIFVLDEADRMLDMGFIHDVKRIAACVPQRRQTLLFSATMPAEVEKLAMEVLHNPKVVKVNPVSSPVEAIDQCLYYVDKANKKHLLASLLGGSEVENCLVFSRTKHGVDRIVRELKRAGIDAVGIHGDKTQSQRQTALNRFKSGDCRVMVATDIAARGLDIAGLSHVINYDQPMEPEAYIHRIGRTGRAGHTGTAISFCCIDEVKQLAQVEKLIGRPIPRRESEWPMTVFTPTEPKPRLPRGERPAQVTMRGEAAEKPRPTRRAEERAPRGGAAGKGTAPQPRRSRMPERTAREGVQPAADRKMPLPVQRVNRRRSRG